MIKNSSVLPCTIKLCGYWSLGSHATVFAIMWQCWKCFVNTYFSVSFLPLLSQIENWSEFIVRMQSAAIAFGGTCCISAFRACEGRWNSYNSFKSQGMFKVNFPQKSIDFLSIKANSFLFPAPTSRSHTGFGRRVVSCEQLLWILP